MCKEMFHVVEKTAREMKSIVRVINILYIIKYIPEMVSAIKTSGIFCSSTKTSKYAADFTFMY